MTDSLTVAIVSGGAPSVVALVSAAVALWSLSKASASSKEIELLKAKLSHGQVIRSTQWNAEFTSYQAIWKSIRTLAMKLVRRESELIMQGLPDGYFSSPTRMEIRKDLIEKLAKASRDLLEATHKNAPFYPASIRESANDAHVAAKNLFDKQMAALTHLLKGADITRDEQFTRGNEELLSALVKHVDHLESLIRERLAVIEIVNSAKA
jgi:hypothetical protein